MKVLVPQLCPILCDPMDWSLLDSSVHGILQTRILEWVAIPFSRGSSGVEPGSPALQADSLLRIWESLLLGLCYLFYFIICFIYFISVIYTYFIYVTNNIVNVYFVCITYCILIIKQARENNYQRGTLTVMQFLES